MKVFYILVFIVMLMIIAGLMKSNNTDDFAIGKIPDVNMKLPDNCNEVLSAGYSYGNYMFITCKDQAGNTFTDVYSVWNAKEGRYNWIKN